MERRGFLGRLQTDDDGSAAHKMMLEVLPFTTVRPGIEIMVTEEPLKVSSRNAVPFRRLQGTVNLIKALAGRPVLEHHPRYS